MEEVTEIQDNEVEFTKSLIDELIEVLKD